MRLNRRAVNRGTVSVDPAVLAADETLSTTCTDDEIFARSDHDALREAIGRLPADFRDAVLLHYFSELPIAKVARILGISSGTVKWRLSMARKVLAHDLGEAVGKAKKPLAVLGALLLGVATLFAAYQTGFVDAVKSYFAAEIPVPVIETSSASSVPEAIVSAEPTSNSAPTSKVVNVELNITFETNENDEARGEEPMKLTKTLKTAAVAAVMSVGSACAEPMLFYVDANSTGAVAPYSTWGTAATTIADALAAARTAVVTEQSAASAEIRIKSGTAYAETGFTLDFPVAIIGDSGNPEDVVIVDQVSKSRAFAITHADAVVKDDAVTVLEPVDGRYLCIKENVGPAHCADHPVAEFLCRRHVREQAVPLGKVTSQPA